MKRVALCITLAFFVSKIMADEPTLRINEVISQNNKYRLNLINTINENNSFIENWELIKIDSNEVIYNFVCYQFTLSGKKVFISDDGNMIVFVDWFLPVDWVYENRQSINNKIVIKFYFMGEEINRYRLSDVFSNLRLRIQSVSHFQWTRYNQDRSSIIMENNQIIIKTLELYEYRFNINNGVIINRRRKKKKLTALNKRYMLSACSALRVPQKSSRAYALCEFLLHHIFTALQNLRFRLSGL
jgi:hypothetical protein